MTTYFDGFLKSSNRITNPPTGTIVGLDVDETGNIFILMTDQGWTVYSRLAHGTRTVLKTFYLVGGNHKSVEMAKLADFFVTAIVGNPTANMPYLNVYYYPTGVSTGVLIENIAIAADKSYGVSSSISNNGAVAAVIYEKYIYRRDVPGFTGIKQYSSKLYIYRGTPTVSAWTNPILELAWTQPAINETEPFEDTQLHCVKVSPDGNTILASSYWYTYVFTYGMAGEITTVSCTSGSALNGKYVVFNDTPTTTVGFWFDTAAASAPPPAAGITRLVRVGILSTDTSTQVAEKLAAVTNGQSQFKAITASSVVTVYHTEPVAMPNAVSGTSGFVITVVRQGGTVGWTNSYTYDSHQFPQGQFTSGYATTLCFEDNNSFILYCLEGLLHFKYISSGNYQKTQIRVPLNLPNDVLMQEAEVRALKLEISIAGSRMCFVCRESYWGLRGKILLYLKIDGVWTFDKPIYGPTEYDKSKILFCSLAATQNYAIVSDSEGNYEYA